jgi:uncharacterized protein YcbK (DUF882 family)
MSSFKITENFSSEEFDCRCGCGKNNISPFVIHRLQVIRDIVKVPISIDSACRCEKHNKEVGGEPNSYHLYGLAVDWTIPESSLMLARVCTNLIPDWSGGFHYYPDKNFCHTDIGPRRRW